MWWGSLGPAPLCPLRTAQPSWHPRGSPWHPRATPAACGLPGARPASRTTHEAACLQPPGVRLTPTTNLQELRPSVVAQGPGQPAQGPGSCRWSQTPGGGPCPDVGQRSGPTPAPPVYASLEPQVPAVGNGSACSDPHPQFPFQGSSCLQRENTERKVPEPGSEQVSLCPALSGMKSLTWSSLSCPLVTDTLETTQRWLLEPAVA